MRWLTRWKKGGKRADWLNDGPYLCAPRLERRGGGVVEPYGLRVLLLLGARGFAAGGCCHFGRACRFADRERRHRPRRRVCAAPLTLVPLTLVPLPQGRATLPGATGARPLRDRATREPLRVREQRTSSRRGGPPVWTRHVTMQRAKSQGREAARRRARTLDFLTAAWYPVGGGRLCACRPRGALARALCAHLRRIPRSATSDSAAPFAARERRHRPSDKGALCPCGSGPNAR